MIFTETAVMRWCTSKSLFSLHMPEQVMIYEMLYRQNLNAFFLSYLATTLTLHGSHHKSYMHMFMY